MIQPTWDNVAMVIRDGSDDLHAIADALGQEPRDLSVALAEMTDKALLYRWDDNGVTRYGVPRERRVA